jgi:hypothetical protein
MPKIDDHQTGFIIEECQKKLDKGSLFYFYQRIKEFCLRYQLTLLAAQAQSLAQNRWKQVIRVQNDMDVLKITFWKDAFVLLVSRDSVIGALGLAEQRLSMQLNYLQSNKQLNFETGMLLERILEIQELDVEQLLFEATKMICSHIMSFWISNLASSPFQYVALHEASKTIVSTLEVCVADSNLQIIFNRRTGSITIHPTDSVGILTETFYIQALQDLELELNKHYDLLAVLKKVHLVKHLLYAETIALQVGLHKVLDPTSHFECIEEIRSIQASSDYMLYFKSDVMYGCVLCVSVRQNEDSLSLATEFRISLFSPFGYTILT